MKRIFSMISHVFLGLLTLSTVACNDDNDVKILVPDSISINETGLYPEGIAYDQESQTIYLSSIRKGKIVKVSFSGEVTEFIDQDKLKSVLGMTIDKSRNRLLVCNADPGFSEKTSGNNPPVLASLLAYDLSTGEEIFDVNLSSLTPAGNPHLANDVVLDNLGNAYVTSSFTPAVFKVTPEGEASVLLIDPTLAPEPGTFGLNGIEWHEAGFLIMAHYARGTLYKIPLDNPGDYKQISIDDNIHSIDGIMLTEANELIIVSNVFDPTVAKNSVHLLKSDDNWTTAKIEATLESDEPNIFPTTVTTIENQTMVVYSYLFELAVKGNPNHPNFLIKKVSF